MIISPILSNIVGKYVKIIETKINTDKLLNLNLFKHWLSYKNEDANKHLNYFQLSLDLDKDLLSANNEDEILTNEFILNNSEWVTLKRGEPREQYSDIIDVVDLSNDNHYGSGFILRISVKSENVNLVFHSAKFFKNINSNNENMSIHYISPTNQLLNKVERLEFVKVIKKKLGDNGKTIFTEYKKFFDDYIDKNEGRNILVELFKDVSKTYKKGDYISIYLAPSQEISQTEKKN